VRLAGADGEVDALEDVDGLGVRIGLGDANVQVLDLEDVLRCGLRSVVP
jgi:hypothetical protein